jgi:hypothetical protein
MTSVQRRRFVPFFIPLLFGVMSFSNVIGNPRVAALHGSDVLQLIASGMCFGAAIALFAVYMRERRPN